VNLTHDQLLADLHAHVHARELTADDLDRRVAAALGVSVAHYRVYLAVRGALEARRHLLLATAAPAGPPADVALVERIRWQVEVIGGLAAVLYRLAVEAGDREGVSVAARILASLPVLRHTVATLRAHQPRAGRRGVRRG
jgi:hypothetical protein